MACSLLVTHQDVPKVGRIHERVVDGQNGATGETEDVPDAEKLERADDGLCSGDLRCGGFGAGGLGTAETVSAVMTLLLMVCRRRRRLDAGFDADQPVVAPSAADRTRREYLARTPRV